MSEPTPLSASEPFYRWSVRARPEDRRALETLFDLEFPTTPLRAFQNQAGSALWLGPDEWLVLLRQHRSLETSVPCSIVEVTNRNVGIDLHGPNAALTLNSGCPLDLSDKAFPVGACTRTLYAKAEIILWRRESHYHVEVWRSFYPYLWTLLSNSSQEQ